MILSYIIMIITIRVIGAVACRGSMTSSFSYMNGLFVGLIHGIVRVGVLWPSFCEKWCVWSVCASGSVVFLFLNNGARLYSFQTISLIESI